MIPPYLAMRPAKATTEELNQSPKGERSTTYLYLLAECTYFS